MNRLRRTTIYIFRQIMPHVGIPMCFSHSLATYWGLQATAEEGALTWTWRLPWALAAIYLNVGLIRIYDELKDADHDIERDTFLSAEEALEY